MVECHRDRHICALLLVLMYTQARKARATSQPALHTHACATAAGPTLRLQASMVTVHATFSVPVLRSCQSPIWIWLVFFNVYSYITVSITDLPW